MSAHRVILVEDDTDLRESLIEGLTLLGTDVTGVGSAMEFYRTLAGQRFDVAVVDLGLPDEDGYEVVAHLRRETRMGVIILTAREALQDRVRGYDSGADLYFVKPVEIRELNAAVTSLVGRLGLGEEQAAASPAEADPNAWSYVAVDWGLTAPTGEAVRLTPKEKDLMELLLDRPGETVSRLDILDRLGYQADISGNRALDALVRRLRNKVRETAHAELPIRTVHAVGYVFTAPVSKG